MPIIILLLLFCSNAYAADIPDQMAIKAIIGEFENDDLQAGACALANRDTLKGVYGIKSKRVLNGLYSPQIYAKAVKAWQEAKKPGHCQMVRGARHWQSVSDMKKDQGWRDKCEMTYFSGKTYFYKCGS